MKSTGLLIIAATLAVSQANSRLEIDEVSGEEYTTNLQCKENFFNLQPKTLLHDRSLFLHYNGTSRFVVPLLEENDVQFVFDLNSDGTLRFDARQKIEGYYYCSRNISAGVPSDENLFKTVLACPIHRQTVQTTYTVPVGGNVTLLSGVGPGALEEHYRARWFRGFHTRVADANILDGDFSLQIGPLQLSDSDTYYSVVEVCDLPESPCPMNPRCSSEHKTHITLTVYDSPTIERGPESIVVGEMNTFLFTCIVTGAPLLKISWFNNDNNLTILNPSHYKINETTSGSGTRITSVLTIDKPTYKDSGDYSCVATILDDKTGDAEFTAYSNTTLTVIEGNFLLNTVVTEHKQLQIWVELNAALIAEVRAIVYFTPSHDRTSQRLVTTRSVLTANTVMVFQLESHEIPDSIQEDDFLVQVALSVDTMNGSLVPREIEDASTFNLDEPTQKNCRIGDDTQKVFAVVAGSVFVVLVIVIAIICVVCSICKYYRHKQTQRTVRRREMTDFERQRLEDRSEKLVEDLRDIDEKKNKRHIKMKEKQIAVYHGILRGDGNESTTGHDADTPK